MVEWFKPKKQPPCWVLFGLTAELATFLLLNRLALLRKAAHD